MRTVGYPLFLRAVESACGELLCLPAVQLLLYGFSVVLLCAALERFGLSALAAVVATTPLLYSSLVVHLAPSAMTEVPASAFGLVALSALLGLSLARGRAVGLWILFGATLLVAYQIRPAFLFLVPLSPLAVLVWSRSLRRAGVVLLVAVVPFLAFSFLRWVVVGHFGLVGFAGYNLSGIATSMVGDEVIEVLPAEDQELASRILAQRQARGLPPLTASSPYDDWQESFNINAWKIAIPQARGLWREFYSDRPPEIPRDLFVDRRLSRFSISVIRQRPRLYAVWLARSWLRALRLTAAKPWIWLPALLCLFSAAVCRWRCQKGGWSGAGAALNFLLLAVAFYLASLALTLLVEPPEWRYLASAELLLPGAMLAAAVELWRSGSGKGAVER